MESRHAPPPDLKRILSTAISSTSKDDGWSNLGEVGSYLVKSHAAFDPRDYGHTKLGELVRSSPTSTSRTCRGRPDSASSGAPQAAAGPNQVVSASLSPSAVPSPTQATYPSGRTRTAAGAVTSPSTGSSHAAVVARLDRLNAVGPRRDVQAAGLAEVEQHRPRVVKQREDPQRAVRARPGPGRASGARAADGPRRGRSGCRARRSRRPAVCAARPCSPARTPPRPEPACARRGAERGLRHRVLSTRAATGWRSAW